MKDYDQLRDRREKPAGWLNMSNMLAVIALVFFLFLALGLKYIGKLENEAALATVTTTTKPVTTTEIRSTDKDLILEELLQREENLENMLMDIREIAGIRSRIISELESKMDGLGLEVNIDKKTGDIRLSEALLFGVNIQTVSIDGETYLKTFIPAFLSVVLSEENRVYIDQIVIEGHTDDEGSYLSNLALSQARASSVVTVIFQNNLNILDDGTVSDGFFAISGRSFSTPIIKDGVIDKSLSRRVEFKFKLKDADLIEQMIEIYEGEN